MDWANGPIRDIYYLGVSDNKMVIAYRGMGTVYIQSHSTLRQYDGNRMEQNRKYGNNECSYAEFPLISYPTSIKIIGNTQAHVGCTKPAVETWTDVSIGSDGSPDSQSLNNNKSW